MSTAVPRPFLTVRNVSNVYDPAAGRACAFFADGTISKECTRSEE